MRTGTYALAALAVAAAGVAGMALAPLLGARGADCGGAQVGGGAIGGPFTLVDGAGRTVTDREVLDRPAIVYFGFASCPDVCPLDLARNAQAVDLLAERGIAARPVFVTIDPARDTPAVVGAYAAAFHPDMVGLTGSDAQVAEAARAYRVYYAKAGEGDADYLMDHSSYSYLTLPGTGFVDVVGRDAPPEAVAERLACHIAAGA